MIEKLIWLCTSNSGLFWLMVLSDLAIATSYFAIPITMAVVLRHRREDIPYPWLWTLFVTFIVACGMTHLIHVWVAFTGLENIALQTAVSFGTALASVATALAFAWILPQIKMLPSPKQQRELLAATVAKRTVEKDALIGEINHRVGNQLQILNALVHMERKRASAPETEAALDRLQIELEKMGDVHLKLSAKKYGEGSKIAAGVVSG
jgi:hypothetical protein